MGERFAGDPCFVGRAAQLTAIRAILDQTRDGQSFLVWIEGDAGAGKTALLRQVLAELPEDFTVFRAAADDVARSSSFAVVQQLADDLPADPFAAGLGLLGRLADRPDQGPVLVAVEDLQWADPASRAALLTMARRLSHDRLTLVITSRPDIDNDGWDRLQRDPRCRRLVVGPLDAADVVDLANTAGVPLTRSDAQRLHAHTGGHPLWTRVLLGELTLDQLQSTGDLPAPRSLAVTIAAQLAGLSADAAAVASGLAVVGPAPLPLLARVAGVSDPAPAWQVLLDAGMVSWSAETVVPTGRFSHPLYRASIYSELSVPRRRQLHLAAAAALGPTLGLEHRVAAASGLDEALAEQLARAAAVQRSSAPSLAADYLLWASSLSAQPATAEQHLLEAVRLLQASGLPSRVVPLQPRVEKATPGPARSVVLGNLAWHAGHAPAAERWWQDAMASTGSSTDAEIGLEAAVLLGTLFYTQGRGQAAVDVARQLLARADLPPNVDRSAWITLAVGRGCLSGAEAGLAVLTERLPQPSDDVVPADVDLLVTRGSLGFFAGHSGAAIADFRAAIRWARAGAHPTDLVRAHVQLAQLLFLRGDWDDAFRHARVASSLAEDDRTVWMQAQVNAVLGRLHAGRGEWPQAQRCIGAARGAAASLGTAEAVFTARIAAATVARAQGRPSSVIDSLADLVDPAAPRALPMLTTVNWWPMLVSAFIEVGNLTAAADHLDRLARAAQQRRFRTGGPITAVRAELLAAQGHPDAAAEAYLRAVAQTTDDDPILDRIELHRRYGRLLVARGRRRDGMAMLRHAHELASRCDARPFLQRIDIGRKGSADRLDERARGTSLRLTERERDVVTLVAEGLTNKEVAGELYLSVKAVEYHLSNVYAKFGLSSRRDVRAILSQAAPAGPMDPEDPVSGVRRPRPDASRTAIDRASRTPGSGKPRDSSSRSAR